MKSLNRSDKSILTIAMFAATIMVGAAFQHQTETALTVPTVTIAAQRMTEQEKIAYDFAQSGTTVQTVLIQGKRLNAEEKIAFDQQDRQIRQAKARAQKKAALLV